MSSMGDGSGVDMSSLSNMADTGNSYDFSSGLGNIDPNSGMNSLNAGLTGPGAGTLPNGYFGSNSNYLPDGTTDGISAGSLNGNTSFTMPNGSTGQMLSQALGMGSKLAGSSGGQQSQRQGGNGRVAMHQVVFANPTTDFAGSAGGSQMGNSLLQLLAKYHPGSQ